MITGINHITLSVRNLEESINFYTNVLAFRLLVKWMSLTVSIEDFPILSQRIQQSGAKIWQENKSEGASLYFLDPNDHKLEIHASDLKTRINSAKASPWEGLEFFI
ncbi:VOC family protein [Nostoc sp. LEGE 12450]|uniref:VOC family protein n=1 Tax=Nostoc sp. LEGE 12450 TaxID=1828643 RepID=UPI00187E2273|nr:VOC family protein [Nostoc sp. LEGE 12450]MBE8989482.1 VOC family protein [Nostoc sp. LEGE 12450]